MIFHYTLQIKCSSTESFHCKWFLEGYSGDEGNLDSLEGWYIFLEKGIKHNPYSPIPRQA